MLGQEVAILFSTIILVAKTPSVKRTKNAALFKKIFLPYIFLFHRSQRKASNPTNKKQSALNTKENALIRIFHIPLEQN